MLSRLISKMRDSLPRASQGSLRFYLDRLRGYHEPEMVLVSQLFQLGGRVIHGGGNRGAYAHALHQLGGRVEVLEPNPARNVVLGALAQFLPKPAVLVEGEQRHLLANERVSKGLFVQLFAASPAS